MMEDTNTFDDYEEVELPQCEHCKHHLPSVTTRLDGRLLCNDCEYDVDLYDS